MFDTSSKTPSLSISLLLLLVAGAASADPPETQQSCSATVKSCLAPEHGTVTVYSYEGYDSTHATPHKQSPPLGYGESESYFGCIYARCDFKFTSSKGKEWWVHDVCAEPTLICSPGDSDNCTINASGPSCP